MCRTIVIAFIGFIIPAVHGQRLMVDVKAFDRNRVLTAARECLLLPPITIAAYPPTRSAGGPNEFFSEGDYWWPDSANPEGPYVQRDGMTNPENFVKHREVMIRFSRIVSTLAAAYKITGEIRYAAHAMRHMNAWFVDSETMMYPHLKYAQAIKGRLTGRGIGIIDTIHLIEVAKSVEIVQDASPELKTEAGLIQTWFREYLKWLTTHQYGNDERDAKNNHGTWWLAQVAAFAHLVQDQHMLSMCRERFRTVLLRGQVGEDGSFPLEVRRTKPYNYSIFNLDGMTLLCQILSTPDDNLWEYTLPDGRGIRKSVEFLYPYLKDKTRWPFPADVMYFEHYPARLPSLIFAGEAYNKREYVELWKKLEADPVNEEVQRNFAIRQPVLWLER